MAMTERPNQIKAFATQRFESLLRRVPTGPDGVARVGARQIYILPTRTGLMFGAVLMVMLLGSLNYQNNLGLLFTFFLASVGIVAMHHAWFNLLGLAVQVRGGPAVFAGETATFEVTLRAEGRRARYDIQVRKGKDGRRPRSVPGGDQRLATLGLPATRRGLLRIEWLTIETRHPMQLLRAWCYVATDAATLVYPLPAPHAPPPDQDAGDGRRPQEQTLGGRGGLSRLARLPAWRFDPAHRLEGVRPRARALGQAVRRRGGTGGLDRLVASRRPGYRGPTRPPDPSGAGCQRGRGALRPAPARRGRGTVARRGPQPTLSDPTGALRPCSRLSPSRSSERPESREILWTSLLVLAACLPLPALSGLADQRLSGADLLRPARRSALANGHPQPLDPRAADLRGHGQLSVRQSDSLAGQDGGTALFATMLALKLLELNSKRDLRLVAIVLGFLIVIQFLFDQSIALTLYHGVIVLGAVTLLVDLNGGLAAAAVCVPAAARRRPVSRCTRSR